MYGVNFDDFEKKLTLSHLEKILFSKTGFTKGEIIQYYIEIAPVLLGNFFLAVKT